VGTGGRTGVDGLLRAATAIFAARFGGPPTIAAAAPGRVNLIGEHTDYNGGLVLPMAIDRQVVMVAAPPAPGGAPRLRLWSETLQAEASVPLQDGLAPGAASGRGHWTGYLRGVVAGLQAQGLPVPSLDVVVVSDVPPGAGLASSAALAVATATLVEAATGRSQDPLARARLCQGAEQTFAGVPCGIMDQLVAVAGQAGCALLIDCQSEQWQPVPLPDELAVLVTDTQVRHANSDGAYALRRAECEEAARLLGLASLREASVALIASAQGRLPPLLLRRARHVVEENARTLTAAQALGNGAGARVGALMYASHRSLRDDFEVSCPELDALVDVAQAIGSSGGVLGARMTGGGFGGCTLTLVERHRRDAVAAALREGHLRRTGRDCLPFVVAAVDGARVLAVA
jgi:galactokinase